MVFFRESEWFLEMGNILLFSLFFLGITVGSFLNVCIYRVPAGLSIVKPRSRCPNCETAILWFHNIPLLSYLLLRGRCASCSVSIPVRYPLIEALTGVGFLGCGWFFGPTPAAGVYCLFVAALIVITFIDLDHQIIPDVISLPGIIVGFFCSFAIPWLSWSDSLLGILLGGGSLWLVAVLYELLTKKEGMGGGDIKLLGMLGAFLGWKAILPIIFVSSLIGSLIGVPLMLVKKADSKLAIPFGPFLALGALIYLFWGPQLIAWYLSFY